MTAEHGTLRRLLGKEGANDDAGRQRFVISTTARPHWSPWRITSWICAGFIILCLISCIVVAAQRSTALTQVTVRVLDPAAETRDHHVPLIKQKEALPDYELIITFNDGRTLRLGERPDTSAAVPITWHPSDLPPVNDIATIQLVEQDQVISDLIADVEVRGETVIENGYQFDFTTEHRFATGLSSFFKTPIGLAIMMGFGLAVFLMVVSALH